MEGIQVFQHDFDNMENHMPVSVELLGIFAEGEGLSAHGKVSTFLSEMKPIKHYLGYDGKIYPKFTLIKIEIK